MNYAANILCRTRSKSYDDKLTAKWSFLDYSPSMTILLNYIFSSSYNPQGETGTRRPDTRNWNDNDSRFNDAKDPEEDYDDYDRETGDKNGNMDWDSIGDFSQYPKAAGSDVRKIHMLADHIPWKGKVMERLVASVTRFSEISTLWQTFKIIWQFFAGLFIIWQ